MADTSVEDASGDGKGACARIDSEADYHQPENDQNGRCRNAHYQWKSRDPPSLCRTERRSGFAIGFILPTNIAKIVKRHARCRFTIFICIYCLSYFNRPSPNLFNRCRPIANTIYKNTRDGCFVLFELAILNCIYRKRTRKRTTL